MGKKYAIQKFRGEFLTDYDEEYCSWSFIPSWRKEFDTYQKAYYTAKKINKAYHSNVATVVRV